ncbi:hypothetical protein M011DRAFT_494687 [Sporormia fimetaria CBS 119925]|uniref:Uncharacterized protein n=1 Tax=Sporormia fimetaria CBS 119925 TaxID=1340428 RepID=A0A6A6V862_9PLEO|nr:hypothetical protein M011DRAFT_494687 [Sporormia fimetaria CBS 119925]
MDTLDRNDVERPHLSITLPRNFQFHYHDQSPRTPEPQAQEEDLRPPPPPRQTLKVRRRRTTAVAINYALNDPADAYLIPTIEASHLSHALSPEPPAARPVATRYLSPPHAFARMLSPPKTPVSQVRIVGEEGQQWVDMSRPALSDTSSRPTSSSGFSDSSLSSRGSLASFPSCTSPEEDSGCEFPVFSPNLDQPISSPLASHAQIPKMKIKVRAVFTEEMDRHLWVTYMNYLQDPTVTPFKALPSTVPPNGACHRVARMARKTWRGPRAVSFARSASRYTSRSGTPDTIKPAKSGSTTPVPGAGKIYMRFPSEKHCRKRLRYLAKNRPSLSAHYQRLLERSPSPFQSSPPREREPSPPRRLSSPFTTAAPSFSTRDMNVSLTTSTAESMQSGNPLAQLANDLTPRPAYNDWARVRASAHQKSQSLHIGLGLGNMLGSFERMSEMTDESINHHNAQTWHVPSGEAPRLGSPLRLHAPRPISRPFRRPTLRNFEEQLRSRGDSFVDQVFGAPAESSHRRVRSRGFSLGDMMEGARRLPSMKAPSGLSAPSHEISPVPEIAPLIVDTRLADGQATVRLGSPFNAKPNNTFPRASTSYGFEQPASFEQRFASFPTPDLSERS